jgi:hypothetical protein
MTRLNTTIDAGKPTASAEERFAMRVRSALDQSANALPQATLARLALARKAALRAQLVPNLRLTPAGQFAMAGGDSRNGSQGFGFGRASFVFSAVVLVGACLAGLYQFEQDRRIEELADMDSAVLNDDLPISAYADHGFNAFLKQNP